MKEQNRQYIVNLAEEIVGRNIISGFKEDSRWIDPERLYSLLSPQIVAKVEKMTSETLGRICAYGDLYSQEGWDTNGSDFILKTTIQSVHPGDFSSKMSGRALLEQIATSVIVSVAYDIIHQDERDADLLDWQMDRAEHAMIHSRSSAHAAAQKDKYECQVHGSMEHMQSVNGLCPGCGKP